MAKWRNQAICGVVLAAFLVSGCSKKDVERIGKVSNKALDKASKVTNTVGEKMGLSIPNARTALGSVDLSSRVSARLKWDKILQGTAIQVAADRDDITLSGTVQSQEQVRRAVRLAETTLGVNQVTEKLTVRPANPSTNGRGSE